MTTHVAYEVRVQRKDNWRVEAVFDDEKLAVAAARRVEARVASMPVVVLQEIYDVARNHLKSRSIYRSHAPHLLNAAPPAATPTVRALRRGIVIVLATTALLAVMAALLLG